MSTHATPETRHASTAEATDAPEFESEPTEKRETETHEDPAPIAPFDAHNSAATFDADNTGRLPNTVDDENKYLG